MPEFVYNFYISSINCMVKFALSLNFQQYRQFSHLNRCIVQYLAIVRQNQVLYLLHFLHIIICKIFARLHLILDKFVIIQEIIYIKEIKSLDVPTISTSQPLFELFFSNFPSKSTSYNTSFSLDYAFLPCSDSGHHPFVQEVLSQCTPPHSGKQLLPTHSLKPACTLTHLINVYIDGKYSVRNE